MTFSLEASSPRDNNGARFLWILSLILLWATNPVPCFAQREERLIFLGDSLTSGYGVAKEEAYPALIARHAAKAGVDLKVINAGQSGDTSAGGLRRLDWYLREPASILVVALGANDALRGLPVEEVDRNLRQIIERARNAYPGMTIVLAGMYAPPNMGPEYTSKFYELYPRIAKDTGSTLIPFLLEGVAGNPNLNQPDLMHPTKEGHEIIAKLVWEAIAPLVRSKLQTTTK